MGSVSSMRASNNIVFQDGGTGGGNQKLKQKPRQLSSKAQADGQKMPKPNAFNTDKKKPGGINRFDDGEVVNDDYNLQSEFQARAGSTTGVKPGNMNMNYIMHPS